MTVKAPAALAVLAIAWWCWKGSWQRRATALAAGVADSGRALVTGLGSGSGSSWLKSASLGTVASSFSVLGLSGITSSSTANLVQLAGILAAVVLVICVPRGKSWVGALAVGLAAMAICAANPQPWYLLWAVPVVACTLHEGGLQRAAILILCAMTAWSELPLAVLVWFSGIIALTVMWVSWMRSSQELDGPQSPSLPSSPSGE